jgi:hypothetical protein
MYMFLLFFLHVKLQGCVFLFFFNYYVCMHVCVLYMIEEIVHAPISDGTEGCCGATLCNREPCHTPQQRAVPVAFCFFRTFWACCAYIFTTFVYMCVYTYIYIYIYIHTHIHTHAQYVTHTCSSSSCNAATAFCFSMTLCAFCAYIFTTCVYTYVYIHTHMYMYTHTNTYMHSMFHIPAPAPPATQPQLSASQ